LPCKQGVMSSNLTISTRCDEASLRKTMFSSVAAFHAYVTEYKTAYESKLSTPFSIRFRTLLVASRMYLENRILKISR
ncbi:MAG: hypothetical protein ACI3YT_09075, partial [Prevotella sp.]